MKRLIVFLIFALAVFNAYSQYYGNTLKIVYGHRSIPVFCTGPEENNYHVKCSFTPEVEKFVNSAKVSSLLRLEPWQERDGEAFMEIYVEISDLLVDKRAFEVTDNYGHIMFKPGIECTMTAVVKVETELDRYFPARKRVAVVHDIDKLYPEPFLAEEYVDNNKDVFIRQAVTDQITKMTDEINGYVYQNYLYGVTENYIRVFFFDTPKNENYETHKTAKTEISRIFSDLTSNYDLASARERMKPWLEHFEKLYNSYDINDKKQKTPKMQMLKNLAVINYALDDFVQAYRYASELKENFPGTEAEKILAEILNTKNLLKAHGLTSRYF